MKNSIKLDFPILKNIHYLDNAATTQKPSIVIKALKEFYEKHNANAHRGIYRLAEDATARLDDSRKVFAKFINSMPEEIIFTKGTTEGLNQLANSLERTLHIARHHNIVVTEIEHHSNFVPWQQLCKRNKAEFRIVKYYNKKQDLDDIAEYVDENTIAVSFAGMSNVSGLILNIKDIIKRVRKKSNALIIVDAAQAVAHKRLDVKAIDADFVCFSAHKIYGTTGVGILYGKKELLEKIEPFLYGGNMINIVTEKNTSWAELPDKFEAGTMDVAGITASAQAIRYLELEGFDQLMKQEELLKNYLLKELKKLDYVKIIGHDRKNYGPVVSFTVKNVHPHDLATICDRHDVCIRAGHHCAMPFMNALGVSATARASISFYNSKNDIDMLVKSVKDAWKIING